MQLGFLEEKKIVNKLWQFLLSPVESRIVKPNTVILEDVREFRIQLKLVHKIIFTHNVSNPSGLVKLKLPTFRRSILSLIFWEIRETSRWLTRVG
jgi:hypothetical protein